MLLRKTMFRWRERADTMCVRVCVWGGGTAGRRHPTEGASTKGSGPAAVGRLPALRPRRPPARPRPTRVLSACLRGRSRELSARLLSARGFLRLIAEELARPASSAAARDDSGPSCSQVRSARAAPHPGHPAPTPLLALACRCSACPLLPPRPCLCPCRGLPPHPPARPPGPRRCRSASCPRWPAAAAAAPACCTSCWASCAAAWRSSPRSGARSTRGCHRSSRQTRPLRWASARFCG